MAELSERVAGRTGSAATPCSSARAASAATCARLIEQSLPQLPVLAYTEIVPGIRVEAVGPVVAA